MFMPEFRDAAMRAVGLEAWLREQGNMESGHKEAPAERSTESMGTDGLTYEPPVVEDLGSLEELTQKGNGAGDSMTMGKKS
jgi:hypothetical protein